MSIVISLTKQQHQELIKFLEPAVKAELNLEIEQIYKKLQPKVKVDGETLVNNNG